MSGMCFTQGELHGVLRGFFCLFVLNQKACFLCESHLCLLGSDERCYQAALTEKLQPNRYLPRSGKHVECTFSEFVKLQLHNN